MSRRFLITGAAGFIGHHVVEHILKNTDDHIVIIDRLDFSGNLNRLAEIGCVDSPRVKFIYHNLRSPIDPLLEKQIGKIDVILHLAAGTHVDRSISHPMEFVQDNVVATCNLLEFARQCFDATMIYFSTDEVFGPAPDGVAFKEWDRYKSGNPYAATKAGAEELCIAYQNTYKLNVMVTHCMNVFGERQHPEKFIPKCISKIQRGEFITIHADKECKRAGSRFYIHARNVADGVMFVLDNGQAGEKYNIVGELEVDNLQLASHIADFLQMPIKYKMVDFHSSRPGHDLRYALDGEKLAQIGWTPPVNFADSLRHVVDWTRANPRWTF